MAPHLTLPRCLDGRVPPILLSLARPSLDPLSLSFSRCQSFTYTVSDGSDSAKAGTVYLVSGGGLLEATEFDFGVGTWQVQHLEAQAYQISGRKPSF